MQSRALCTMIGVAALALSAIAQPSASNAAPSNSASTNGADARKANVRRYIAIWQSGHVDRLGSVIATGYVGHAASGNRDIIGLRQRIAEFRTGYSDMRFTIEDQFAVGDRVATRMTAVGIAAKSGQRVRLVGLNISRFAGNRIVEEWPVWEVASENP